MNSQDNSNSPKRDRLQLITAEAILAAQARLVAARRESEQRKLSANGSTYYGTKTTAHLEETIAEPTCTPLDAVVTRNHYGCLVLNTARAVFIDVDYSPSDQIDKGAIGRGHSSWESMLEDLSLVLRNESDLGFRMYRTKAGFRMLVTNREFEPVSARVGHLMKTVSADLEFEQLCRIQNNFRARLTPKPWRCGAKRPPNFFPRETSDARQAFSQWLAGYEQACRGRATCQYLGHVGSRNMHPRIAPVVELHDRETKAFQPLPLA
jgi:hypothetical protein